MIGGPRRLGSLLDCSFSECFFFLAFIALITISSKSHSSWSQRKPLDYPFEKEKTHEATALMEFKASYREHLVRLLVILVPDPNVSLLLPPQSLEHIFDLRFSLHEVFQG